MLDYSSFEQSHIHVQKEIGGVTRWNHKSSLVCLMTQKHSQTFNRVIAIGNCKGTNLLAKRLALIGSVVPILVRDDANNLLELCICCKTCLLQQEFPSCVRIISEITDEICGLAFG